MSRGAEKMKRLLADFSLESALEMVPHFQGSLAGSHSQADTHGNAAVLPEFPRQANIPLIAQALTHEEKSLNLISFGRHLT